MRALLRTQRGEEVVSLLWIPGDARRFFGAASAMAGVALLALVLATHAAAAQRTPGTNAPRHPVVDTIGVASPESLAVAEPTSRLVHYGKSLPGSLAVGSLMAGVGQLINEPEEWERTWRGYGRRSAAVIGGYVVQTTIEHSLAALLDRPVSYTPCACPQRSRRIGWALAGTVTDPLPDGGRAVAVPRIAAAYLGALARSSWLPDHDHRVRDVMVNGSISLAIDALLNLFQERRAWQERDDGVGS